MKRIIIMTAIAVLLGMASAYAQQIAVVSESGETTVYQTFQAAIEGASEGSVIYLPGGSFSLPDSVKITKRLTIIGIGHRSDNDNVDAKTWVAGNLWFNEGSSGSAVMACYITGNVNIGEGDASVNNILVKFCNLNGVQVLNNTCANTYINQNYVRNCSYFHHANGIITNNVIHSITNIDYGQIYNNIFLSYGQNGSDGYSAYMRTIEAYYSSIHHNVITTYTNRVSYYWYNVIVGSDNTIFSNICQENVGDNTIILSGIDWNTVFEGYNGGAIDPMSNFHFTNDYAQYENQIGIYGGTSFDNHQTAPVPYIVAKRIDQETDAAGQLKIQVRVKASE